MPPHPAQSHPTQYLTNCAVIMRFAPTAQLFRGLISDSKSGGLNARVGSIPSSGTIYLLQAKGERAREQRARTSRLFVTALLTQSAGRLELRACQSPSQAVNASHAALGI